MDSLTLSTGVETVDRALRGGIAARSITEIVGPAGVGKTQFAMMLACRSLVQVPAVPQPTTSSHSHRRPHRARARLRLEWSRLPLSETAATAAHDHLYEQR